jgi:hypothetical protein
MTRSAAWYDDCLCCLQAISSRLRQGKSTVNRYARKPPEGVLNWLFSLLAALFLFGLALVLASLGELWEHWRRQIAL